MMYRPQFHALWALFLCLFWTIPGLVVSSPESAQVYTIPLIPHHVQRERRHMTEEEVDAMPRRREEGALTVGALYQGYGTHYVDLWVGTPPQRQTVIVDTGSGVTAFPCGGCQDCGDSYHIDKFFIEADSKTFRKMACDECTRGSCSNKECRISMSYQEGSSWTAYEGQDLTYAGGLHDEPLTQDSGGEDIDPRHAQAFAFPLKFGCQTKITGLFKTQLADGIMGMDSASTAYWSQMHAEGMLKEQKFALCYSRQPTSERSGTEAGALTFGGAEDRLHTSPMVYTGGKNGRAGFFSVYMRKVYLREGGAGDSATATDTSKNIVKLNVDEATLNRGGIIVDSGTTDTYFSNSISKAFNAAYQEITGNKYSHDAVDLTAKDLESMPTILFQIAGDEESNKELYGDNFVTGLAGQALDKDHPYDVIVAFPPSHYMEYDDKKEKYVARFYVDEGGGSVFGGNAIMGHDVFFDIDNNRIGWAESSCDYSELVKNYEFDASSSAAEATSKKEQQEEDTAKEDQDDDKAEEEPTDKDGGHEHEDPEHDVSHDWNKDGSSTSTGVAQVCSSASCRASVFAALMGVLFVGIFVGRVLSRRNELQYHGTELEVPTLHLDEADAVDFSPRYRDEPDDDDVVAEEGVGYENDDELHLREVS